MNEYKCTERTTRNKGGEMKAQSETSLAKISHRKGCNSFNLLVAKSCIISPSLLLIREANPIDKVVRRDFASVFIKRSTVMN